jgi:hypothetical protein
LGKVWGSVAFFVIGEVIARIRWTAKKPPDGLILEAYEFLNVRFRLRKP